MVSHNFLENSTFIGSYPSFESLPEDAGSEIAFCGRSNCGKSSVLNAITNNKKLAKTSKTPGRTQSINVFEIDKNKQFKIIDLPGYGYAKVSKSIRADWGVSIDNYLNKRKCLKALVIIMDIRHPLKEDDLTLINWCEANNLPLIVLLNKSDKLSKNKASREQLLAINELEGLSTKYFVLITSAKTKEGVNELIETMMGLLDE
jgi:GTP-binding protein|tara:strand:- start:1588 stop:2196 length:609 start_codon:yes stop_codon:yes gene_type:complete